MMRRIRPPTLLLSSFLLVLTLLSCPLNKAEDIVPRREAFGIIIGGGIGFGPIWPPPYETAPPPPPEIVCAPPPPPPPPPVKVCPAPSSPPPPSPPPPSPPPPPPSPPPPKPKPPPSISPRVLKIYPVVQRFKDKLAYGPPDVLKTWRGQNVCDYKGFSCDNFPDKARQKAVSGVDFNGYGFHGKGDKLDLAGFLDKLEDLVFFHANSNNFTGAIPDVNAEDKIRYFYELDLSNNKLAGTFPREVLQATNLTFLDLRFNGYYGAVPPEVFTLDVQVIFINNNKFSGQLPGNLGKTPALYLTFANNYFTGAIPKSIGEASETLIEVLFLNNKLSGCLPHEIGNLKKMTLFDASGNCITGPIPQSFACLRSIQLLNLARNRLFGSVPESLCELGASGSLQNLTLSENYFTQVGPKCRGLIKKKYLDVDKNCIIDLPNQRSKEECERFFLKKLRCPDEKWMNYIPCQKRWYRAEDEPSDARHLSELQDSSSSSSSLGDGPVRASSFRSSVTYGALTPKGRQ